MMVRICVNLYKGTKKKLYLQCKNGKLQFFFKKREKVTETAKLSP